MKTIYVCNQCGEIFTDPGSKTFTEYHPEVDTRQYETIRCDVCPSCETIDFEEISDTMFEEAGYWLRYYSIDIDEYKRLLEYADGEEELTKW